MKKLIALASCLLLFTGAFAQEESSHSIPDSVFYLMPAFGDGMVYFNAQPPAQGKLNICALDNRLRFIDPSGTELEASSDADIVRVRIDTVVFLRSQGVFYRQYPVVYDGGVALRREVTIIKDIKPGAYGTTSRTSSVKEYSVLYADGVSYSLDKDKKYPYQVSEILCLYKGNEVFPLNKRTLRRLFPARKDEIDAWFKAGNTLPSTLPELLQTLSLWAE